MKEDIILTENIVDYYNGDNLTAEEAKKILSNFKDDKDLTEEKKTEKKFYEYIIKEEGMKNIEKFEKNMEERKIKTVRERMKKWEEEEKEREEKKTKLYKKIRKMIADEGGIYKFMGQYDEDFTPKKLLFTNKGIVDPKWEFDKDKLINRIGYSELSIENKIKILRNNIKENIKEKIKEERLEEIEEKDLDKYINNIIEHELNYYKPHKQIVDKKILKSITYAIGYWSEDKSIFYKSGIMVLIETKEEGWDLIKELKEKGKIIGEKWTVEKNTKELEDKIVYIDQRGHLYNFKEKSNEQK